MENCKRGDSDFIIGSDGNFVAEIDFEDFLIADLAAMIKDIHDVCRIGTALPTVVLGKTTVIVEGQNVEQDARERLGNIVDTARMIKKMELDLPLDRIVISLLRLDEWSVTKKTLRTPLWLRDVQEWPLKVVMSWHEELGCLETYTSS